MNKISKAILIALGALLALVVATLFGVNLYLQSPGVTARIQEELSRALRMPLTITNTSFTPWSDLRITGITVPNGDSNLFEASAFNARYRLSPLLKHKLVIYSVTVENPKFVWAQNAEGKWEMPRREATATPPVKSVPTEPTTTVSTTPAPEAASSPKTAESKPEKKKESKEKRDLQVIVEGGQIKHGTIELLDQGKMPVATLSDVTLDFTKLTKERVEGTAQIGRAVWERTLVIEELRTPFIYADGVIELPALDARLGDGFLKGRLTWNPTAKESPFTVALEFEHIDLARVATDASWGESGWKDGDTAGSLRGTLNLAGSSKEWQRAEGTAKLFLRNGRFRDVFYFELIGRALQIKELSDLRLNDSQADIRFADEKAFIESTTLEASDLQLTGKGLVRIDGKLQIAARLTARDQLFKQLPSLISSNFESGPDNSRFIDFGITGKTSKPKIDLLDKIIGQKVETRFDDLLSSIFNTKKNEEKKDEEKKKDDKKKKKKDDAKDSPASATPAPEQ